MDGGGDGVRFSVRDAIGRVVLDGRPGNPMGLAGARALRDAVTAVLAAPGLRALGLSAAGPAFCVGGDLAELAAAADPASRVTETVETAHEVVVALHASPVPVVTAVHGAAAGAGMGLALLGDVVLAGRSARFRSAYTAAGLSPDCAVSWLLGRGLTPARAADLVLTNRELAAEDAERWGLVSRVVEDDRLAEAAESVLAGLARGSAPALAEARRLLRAAPARALRDHLADEAATVARLSAGPDAQQGVAAFLQRRRPSFAAPPYGDAAVQQP